jgi:RNA polymerase sigma factor (sigma-70 family)
MTNLSDAELLREYASGNSEAAFGEIVRRYADAVHSAALRQVGNEEQGRDVAQSVFVDLARKAAALRPNTLLIGWLYRGVRLAALEQVRKEQRRQQRERQAMDLHDPAPETANDWNIVRPVLDEAIGNLGEEDRDALLLRFFKNESLASVGATLGISEDAAQKRVSRALGKLREFLAGRGINTTAAALSAALTANAVQAAPAGFAVATSSMAPTLKLISLANMKTALLILALAGVVAGLTLKRAATQHELRAARILTQQLAAEKDALRAANEQLAIQTNDLERLRNDMHEVLRLRNEVSQLRRQLAAGNKPASGFETRSISDDSTNNIPISAEPQINVRARFIVAPASLNLPIDNLGNGSGDSKIKAIDQALLQAGDAQDKSQCEVTTLSGNEAQIQMIQSVTNVNPQSGLSTVYTNIGVTLDVLPSCRTNSQSIDLSFVATVNEIIDISPEQDGSQPAFHSLAISNSMTIPSGRMVIVAGKLPAGGRWTQSRSGTDSVEAGPRNLLVLLTPTLVDASNQAQPQPGNGPQAGGIPLDTGVGPTQ